MASILPFVPFQQDLNRLVLVVRDLPGEKAEIKWGQASKVFTKEQLAAGVNLAEFLDNPFSESFDRVMTAVAAKQSLSTDMFLQLNAHLKRAIPRGLPRLKATERSEVTLEPFINEKSMKEAIP